MKRRLFIVQFGPAGKSTRSMFVLARHASDAGSFADQQVQHGEKVVITEVTEPVYDAIDQFSAPCLYEGLPITPPPPPAPHLAN